MMSNPVTSNYYGEQLHNGVNFMMSNHVTLKKKHIRAKQKLTPNKNARCVGFEHIYICLFEFVSFYSLAVSLFIHELATKPKYII